MSVLATHTDAQKHNYIVVGVIREGFMPYRQYFSLVMVVVKMNIFILNIYYDKTKKLKVFKSLPFLCK